MTLPLLAMHFYSMTLIHHGEQHMETNQQKNKLCKHNSVSLLKYQTRKSPHLLLVEDNVILQKSPLIYYTS